MLQCRKRLLRQADAAQVNVALLGMFATIFRTRFNSGSICLVP